MKGKHNPVAQTRMRQFLRRVEQMKLNYIQCELCGKLAETLHHKDENQLYNAWSNLQPVCHMCHLDIPHHKTPADHLPFHKILLRCAHCDCLFTAESKDEEFCGDYCRELHASL